MMRRVSEVYFWKPGMSLLSPIKLLVVALMVMFSAGLGSIQISVARDLTDEEKKPILKGIETQTTFLAKDRLRIAVDPLNFAHNALDLAINKSAVGDKKGALALFEEALAAFKTVPPDKAAMAVDWELWSFLDRYLQGTSIGAEHLPLFLATADACEANNAKRTLTEKSPVLTSLNFFTDKKHFAEAIIVANHVIDLRRKLRSPDDQYLGELFDYLAEQHAQNNSLSELEKPCGQWLSESEKRYGVDNIHILPALVNQTTLNIALAKTADAEVGAQRSLSLVKSVSANEKNYEELAPIIVAYLKCGQVEKADMFVRKMCSGRNSLRSYSETNQLIVAVPLAVEAYAKKVRYEEAISLLKVWLSVQSLNLDNENDLRENLMDYYLCSAGKANKAGAIQAVKTNIERADEMFKICVAFLKRNHRDGAEASVVRRWNGEVESNYLPPEYKKKGE